MEYPSNMAAKGELTRAIQRLAEQEKERYRFEQLYKEATRLRHYTRSVRTSGSQGRCLFIIEAVKAGGLL
jgi:hypothetical protein